MAWIEFKRGITREVFLIGGIAIKFASVRSYDLFLRGILANMQERRWTKQMKHTGLICPTLYKSIFGTMIIMPRCKPTDMKSYEDVQEIIKPFRDAGIPVESKPCSFGIHKGKLVAVDYGT